MAFYLCGRFGYACFCPTWKLNETPQREPDETKVGQPCEPSFSSKFGSGSGGAHEAFRFWPRT
jgi:hypothetical protein